MADPEYDHNLLLGLFNSDSAAAIIVEERQFLHWACGMKLLRKSENAAYKACGMKLLRKSENAAYKYTIAMMGYADEYESTVLELTYNYDVTEYTKGNAYAQIALSTEDVYKSAQVVDLVTKELGGKITRQPGPIPGINTKVTSFLDPDGWKVVFVDHSDFLKELEA